MIRKSLPLLTLLRWKKFFLQALHIKRIKSKLVKIAIILCLSVVQQNMRVTRWIVLPLLTKALYEFGCFEGIFQKAKLALLLFYWDALTRFGMKMASLPIYFHDIIMSPLHLYTCYRCFSIFSIQSSISCFRHKIQTNQNLAFIFHDRHFSNSYCMKVLLFSKKKF